MARSRVPRPLHGVALALALAMVSAGTAATSRSPLRQQAYIWQRSWTPEVERSARDHAGSFSRYILLAAEVTFRNGTPEVVRPALDYSRIRGLSGPLPLGLALRIGPFRGPFAATDPRTTWLATLARSLVGEASAQGVPPAELQIDFDCAESRLAGYEVWVRELRKGVGPTPLTLTTLPSWLKHPEFASLVRAADGFILQVHSVARPTRIDTPFTLCDPAAVAAWVDAAAAVGRPFRVALPTYGYTMAFSRQGGFLGLSAEGPSPTWPEGTALRQVMADPVELSRLVAGWKTSRPDLLQGVIWYRLPVPGDTLNWRWETLDAVMRGRPLASDLEVAALRPAQELVEVEITNRGVLPVEAPPRILVRWSGSRLTAGDGLAGFSLADESAGSVRLTPPPDWHPLEPGGRRRIAWARFNQNTEVTLELLPSPR